MTMVKAAVPCTEKRRNNTYNVSLFPENFVVVLFHVLSVQATVLKTSYFFNIYSIFVGIQIEIEIICHLFRFH